MIVQSIFNFVSIICLSIVMHELGHLYYSFLVNKKAKFVYEIGKNPTVHADLPSTKQYVYALVAGVFIGSIPVGFGLVFLSFDFVSFMFNIGASIIYFFYGAKNDLIEIGKVYYNEKIQR